MSMIDWSKAPEWATGYGLMNGSFGIEEVWFNDKQYLPLQSQGGYGPYPFGGGIGPHMHNATKSQIAFQKHRPAPWSGEGLPPVGTVCEYQRNDVSYRQEWVKVTPKYFGKEMVVLEHSASGEEYVEQAASCVFRPTRTPEQIAAEELKAAIDEMSEVTQGAHDWLQAFQKLHLAGYRKVTP